MPTEQRSLDWRGVVQYGGLLLIIALCGLGAFQFYELASVYSLIENTRLVSVPLVDVSAEDAQAQMIRMDALLLSAGGMKFWGIGAVVAAGVIALCVALASIMMDRKERQQDAVIQNQTYQAQKMEAVRRLAGGLTHDFNNVLAAINGYAEFLIEDLRDQPAEQGFAKKIMAAAKQAREYIDQIQLFSRRNDVGMDVVDFTDVVKASVETLTAQSGGAIDIRYEQLINAEALHVRGSAAQLKVAISHICRNALDEMGSGHVGNKTQFDKNTLTIALGYADLEPFEAAGLVVQNEAAVSSVPRVRFSESQKKGSSCLTVGQIVKELHYISVTITDTGFGMSRSVMEHAFEPFFTTKPMNKGTGIGLSVVQGVVEHHRGAMRIESTMGQGTRVTLLLPRVPEESDFEALVHREEGRNSRTQTARILLVEDLRTVREMAEKMLVRLGHDVVTALNGRHALDILERYNEQWPFDLIFSDHAMPQMDGLELAEHCAERFPDLKFIMVSGYSREKMHDILNHYPSVSAVLRKPITRDVLKAEIDRALQGVALHGGRSTPEDDTQGPANDGKNKNTSHAA